MSNNKQIEFDFSKWGQERIIVYNETDKMITLHKNPISSDLYYGVDEEGYTYSGLIIKFTMYEEIKPREIWVNEFSSGTYLMKAYHTKAEAESNQTGAIGQIKFIEVIEGDNK